MSALLEQARHRLTTADYHKMGAAGIFGPADRVELIEGGIIDMAPIGSAHAGVVALLNNLLVPAVTGKAIVNVQNPIVLGDHSEPQPDLTVLKPRPDFYRDSHPTPTDLILLIEVAETSLDFDRQIKLPLYARYSVPEVWLVDLQQKALTIHRAPLGGAYQETVEQHDLTRRTAGAIRSGTQSLRPVSLLNARAIVPDYEAAAWLPIAAAPPSVLACLGTDCHPRQMPSPTKLCYMDISL